MAELRYVFFDLGDVACHFRPQRRLAALAAASQLQPTDIQQRRWDSGFSAACDLGTYTACAMHAQICHRLGRFITRQDASRLWALAFEPNPEVLAIAQRVRRYLPTGLLTNNSPLLREALPRCLPAVEKQFEPIIFSYQHGACKPGPMLYGAVANRLGVAPNRLLLIDDALPNVQGAHAAGWQAIHYTHPEALREALAPFGWV
jgi:HAD superfamily hydrolase (TIGR01509 family)